jgi:hypothetical protein
MRGYDDGLPPVPLPVVRDLPPPSAAVVTNGRPVAEARADAAAKGVNPTPTVACVGCGFVAPWMGEHPMRFAGWMEGSSDTAVGWACPNCNGNAKRPAPPKPKTWKAPPGGES